MYKPRLIPVLLLQNQGLVKSVQFKKHRYIGDPINAVKIFNDLGADELVFLDIEATKQKRNIDINFLKNISEEANMPFSYGGGIKTLKEIELVLKSGVERVVLGSIAASNVDFVKQACNVFGSSSISVCLDYKKNIFGKYIVYYNNSNSKTNFDVLKFSQIMQEQGVGELIIQSIERDGMKTGYDIEIIEKISKHLTIPIVALGGVKNLNDMKNLYQKTVINGFGAGSMFVYHGNRDGILINYPNKEIKSTIWNKI
jgi:cyclase